MPPRAEVRDRAENSSWNTESPPPLSLSLPTFAAKRQEVHSIKQLKEVSGIQTQRADVRGTQKTRRPDDSVNTYSQSAKQTKYLPSCSLHSDDNNTCYRRKKEKEEI